MRQRTADPSHSCIPGRQHGKREEGLRVISAQEAVVEGDGVHRPDVHKWDSHVPGLNGGVPGETVKPKVDADEVLDEQPVTEQAPHRGQVIDKIPSEIHQFMDRRLNSWSRLNTMVLPR
ncbi:hypothetical protein [Pseudarthrobacter oxydans]|uniref:hypothetical protein n=1 Tax=Pseudarthrobacter oxydans TaxID=1671 RepID=UPI00344F727F